ncbi:glycosyltransferase [Stygiobacter electus]|uniref:Glycosyltransferase n=1 Tax=Stygiobacter electus TaxID=3032292 RepID=A0AAE3P2D0_9BACT|nr:glycosyltransferase [Stygiobacter electus]MDF1613099.1 glycosyltransferase [Stygiobacter electus]
MRILHVIQSLDPKLGGLPAALRGLIAVENELDIRHDILSTHSEYGENDFPNSKIYLYNKTFPKRFNRSKEALKFLKKNIKDYNLLIIHSVWTLIGYESVRIVREFQVPYIIWPHGSLDPFDLQKKSLLKKILGPIFIKPLLSNSAAVCCTSQIEAEKLETYKSKPYKKVLPLPIIIDQVKGSRVRFRENYNYKKDDFVLLFLSRINYKKGLNIIVEGLSKIQAEYPFVKLFIAGSGDKTYLNKLKDWVIEYKLQDKVIIGGQLAGQDKADAFLGSELFVLPSMNENFGIAIFESLYSNLPVLISNNVYLWKDIVENGAGWVCGYSIESFSNELLKIVNNRNDYEYKKKQCSIFAKKYIPDRLSDSYFQFYSTFVK